MALCIRDTNRDTNTSSNEDKSNNKVDHSSCSGPVCSNRWPIDISIGLQIQIDESNIENELIFFLMKNWHSIATHTVLSPK